jgi:hypothetical protein
LGSIEKDDVRFIFGAGYFKNYCMHGKYVHKTLRAGETRTQIPSHKKEQT